MPATVDPVSALLDWYDKNARSLPWRARHGQKPDPYHVWLSEIMLQQTTVTTVKPYFEKFLRLFPTVDALATAEDEAVMAAWAGLGYYSRARNLLKCARLIAAEHGGTFPDEEEALLSLPGIGPIRQRPLPPSPLTARPRRLTAILSGFWRGFMGWRRRCPLLSPSSSRKTKALCRPTDPVISHKP